MIEMFLVPLGNRGQMFLVTLVIRVVSLVNHGRNVLVRGSWSKCFFCFGNDFAFRHARICREVIRDEILSLVQTNVRICTEILRSVSIFSYMQGAQFRFVSEPFAFVDDAHLLTNLPTTSDVGFV
jgi:hypothetical protein